MSVDRCRSSRDGGNRLSFPSVPTHLVAAPTSTPLSWQLLLLFAQSPWDRTPTYVYSSDIRGDAYDETTGWVYNVMINARHVFHIKSVVVPRIFGCDSNKWLTHSQAACTGVRAPPPSLSRFNFSKYWTADVLAVSSTTQRPAFFPHIPPWRLSGAWNWNVVRMEHWCFPHLSPRFLVPHRQDGNIHHHSLPAMRKGGEAVIMLWSSCASQRFFTPVAQGPQTCVQWANAKEALFLLVSSTHWLSSVVTLNTRLNQFRQPIKYFFQVHTVRYHTRRLLLPCRKGMSWRFLLLNYQWAVGSCGHPRW